MKNQNNSSAPSGDDLSYEMRFAVYDFLRSLDRYAEEHGTELVPINRQSAMVRELNSLFATQPPVDRVQGGLTEREIKELWYRNFRSEFDGDSIGFAEDIFRAILSRQSMMGGEAEMVMNAITEGQKRRASESREPAGNMTAELPPHAAVLQDPGEIDERAAFEKFMSKRGWAAVYAGDGLYEMPSVQQQWEVWQGRAAIAAPQEQAERTAVPDEIRLLTIGKLIRERRADNTHGWLMYDADNRIVRALGGFEGMLVDSAIAAAPSPQEGDDAKFLCWVKTHRASWLQIWRRTLPASALEDSTPANAAAANGDGLNIKKQITDARTALEQKWDSEGDCGSCGWHAALCEHDVSDDDIAEALRTGGWLELSCLSKDDEDRDTHRGIRIFIGKAPAADADGQKGGQHD